MNIVACVKITPDAGDITVRPDGSISLDRAEWVIGNFDLQAMEAGMRLAESANPPGKVTVLSAGPRQIAQSKIKKDVLSRGPDELAMVVDDALAGADTAFTARVLADAVRKLGDVDLVLCGEGSADLYFQQVGIHLGELLGLPVFNAVSKITPEGDKVVIERDLEDEVEVLEVPLPAVFMVTTDISEPRLPTMKEILKAGKKPVHEWTLADIGVTDAQNQVEVLSTRAPFQVQRKGVVIPGEPSEAAQALVGYLKKEGIV